MNYYCNYYLLQWVFQRQPAFGWLQLELLIKKNVLKTYHAAKYYTK